VERTDFGALKTDSVLLPSTETRGVYRDGSFGLVARGWLLPADWCCGVFSCGLPSCLHVFEGCELLVARAGGFGAAKNDLKRSALR